MKNFTVIALPALIRSIYPVLPIKDLPQVDTLDAIGVLDNGIEVSFTIRTRNGTTYYDPPRKRLSGWRNYNPNVS